MNISLQEAICEFVSFHLRNQTDFLRFILDGADTQVNDDTQFVWMFIKRYGSQKTSIFLSVDTKAKEINVIQSFSHKHTSGFPASEIYLEVMVSFFDSIVDLFNQQTEPSNYLYPLLVQSAINYFCSVVVELLQLPGITQFMDQNQYGRVAGHLLYWCSKNMKQWFCLDTENKRISSVLNCFSSPKEGSYLDQIALEAGRSDLNDYIAEYIRQYRLFIACNQISKDKNMQVEMSDSGWIEDGILYWRLGQTGFLVRVDIQNCVAHQVEQPTDYVTFSPQLDADQQRNLSYAIDYAITERRLTEELLADIGGNHHRPIPYETFLGLFSMS